MSDRTAEDEAIQQEVLELKGKLQWLTIQHEALTNEHKSLLKLCYKLIKAARSAFHAFDTWKHTGDKQDWDSVEPFHKPYQLLSDVLEDVNQRWP